MDCSHIEKLFRDYLSGNLDRERSCIVENHLKKCRSCRSKMKGLGGRKNILKTALVIVFIAGATFFIINSTTKMEIPFEPQSKKVVSNIIIEVFSADSEEVEIVKQFTNNFGADIIDENPLSIKLTKQVVNGYIEDLSKILVLPDGTKEKVADFIKPLRETDEVVVKIKFIEKGEG